MKGKNNYSDRYCRNRKKNPEFIENRIFLGIEFVILIKPFNNNINLISDQLVRDQMLHILTNSIDPNLVQKWHFTIFPSTLNITIFKLSDQVGYFKLYF